MANFDIAENFIGGDGCNVIELAVIETRSEALGKVLTHILSSFEDADVPLDRFLNGLVYALAERGALEETAKGKALNKIINFIERAEASAMELRELNKEATTPKFHVGQRVMVPYQEIGDEEIAADHGLIVGFKLMQSHISNETDWYYCILFDKINQIEDVLETSVVLEQGGVDWS